MRKTVPELTEAMTKFLVYKLDADMNIGNYKLPKFRHVSDKIDKAPLQTLGLSDRRQEIELGHSFVVRTSYGDDE